MIYGRQTKTAELAEKFRNELLAQRMEKNSPVMSVRELAEHFAVSTVTANRILNLLVEQDFLYRKPSRGTFIKNDPPVIPSIAYAGPLPDPENTDPIKYNAAFRMLEHFTETGLEPGLITYHTLRHPELAERELRKTNGLLIDASFIDEVTLKALWNYSGRIVVIGACYIEEKLSCSQVVPDISEALLEFNRVCPVNAYDKILIVHAAHRNARAKLKMIERLLERLHSEQRKIEIVALETSGSINAYMRASRHFARYENLPEKTLIISLSEFFSQAVREVFSGRKFMPDILSFDNMEGYANDPGTQPWFTSIDCRITEIACRALDLLCGQLKNPVREQTILRIPARLVIRESVKKLCRSNGTAKV